MKMPSEMSLTLKRCHVSFHRVPSLALCMAGVQQVGIRLVSRMYGWSSAGRYTVSQSYMRVTTGSFESSRLDLQTGNFNERLHKVP